MCLTERMREERVSACVYVCLSVSVFVFLRERETEGESARERETGCGVSARGQSRAHVAKLDLRWALWKGVPAHIRK